MEIQTVQAQKALTLAEASSFLPLKPAKESDVVFTFYWVHNFDVIVEKQAGGGAINTTHLVAFQEPTEFSANNTNEAISVEYSRKRTIENIEPKNVSCGSIDSKSACVHLYWFTVRMVTKMLRLLEASNHLQLVVHPS